MREELKTMKRQKTKNGKVSKGAPSGIVISLLVHAAAFFIAGLFVVFTVVNKPEPEFSPPPPLERPKMKLKKPKVKVKKSSQPKPSARIVAKVRTKQMPEIQLPDLMGTGDGLIGGIGLGGEFMDLPDLSNVTIMGSANSIGSDLEGTFYDLNRMASGRPSGIGLTGWREEFRNFLTSGWDPNTLSRYYRLPQKLYANCLIFPPASSARAPAAFGDPNASGAYWMVHYTGQIAHSEGITFRFWVNSDENLVIKLNDEIVAACTWRNVTSGEVTTDPNPIAGLWETSDAQASSRFFMGNNRAIAGDWITLEPGVPVDIEMVLGDNGGEACFMICVEEQGVKYPKNAQGGPLFPAFKTAAFSHDMLDLIYKNLVPDEISLTNGPVFNDYASSTGGEKKMSLVEEVPEPIFEKDKRSRMWALKDGRRFEACLMSTVGNNVFVETSNGKQVKISPENLSAEDLYYLELSRPPKLNIDFLKKFKQKNFTMDHVSTSTSIRAPEDRGYFGVRVKQSDHVTYNHKLDVEFFAIGEERIGHKFILLDRKKFSFMPTKENGREMEYRSPREVVLENYVFDRQQFGETYATHLVTVTDEMGEIVAVSAPSEWLYENLSNLRQLQPGNYMNKKCERVFPTRPEPSDY
jgi:hypothetical protein